jgi:hypothetical protein
VDCDLNTTNGCECNAGGSYDCVGTTCKAVGITISGSCKNYDGSTNCAAGETVKLAINSSLQAQTGTIRVDGTWSIYRITTLSNGNVVTVFIDGVDETFEATAVTKYDDAGDIVNMELREARLTIGRGDNQTLTVADLSLYTNSNDEDIKHIVSGSTLTIDNGPITIVGAGLRVLANNTFAPGAGTTVNSGIIHISSGATLTASSSTINLTYAGTVFILAGTFNCDTSTVNYAGDMTGSSPVTVAGTTYYNLGVGTNANFANIKYTLGGDTTVKDVLTVGNAESWGRPDELSGSSYTLTLSGSGTPFNITPSTFDDFGTPTGGGFFSAGTSTVAYTGATATNIASATYHKLNIGGFFTTTTYTAAGNITVTNVLTIVPSFFRTITFNASSYTITLSGIGTPFVISAGSVFAESTSTVKYTGDGTTNITAATYNNLELSPTITDNRAYTGAGAIAVGGALNINPSATAKSLTFILGGTTSVTGATTIQRASTATSILDTNSVSNYTFNTGSLTIKAGGTLNGRASALDSNGDVTIEASGTLTCTSGNFNVGGSWSNSATGVFTHSSGTVIFDTGAKTSIFSGSNIFYNLTSTTSSKRLLFSAGTTQFITGALTLNGKACGSRIFLRAFPEAPGNTWNINVSGASTVSVSFIDVKDSQATGESIAADSSIDSGNNLDWDITPSNCVSVSGYAWSENIGWISFNYANCLLSTNCTCPSRGAEKGCPNISYPCNNSCADLKEYEVKINPDTGPDPGDFSGYAWSEKIGWISFNRGDNPPGDNPPSPPFDTGSGAIAKLDLTSGGTVCGGKGWVCGWARALSHGGGWDGWIKLRKDQSNDPLGKDYGVRIDTVLAPKEFKGFAWDSEVVGWISFNHSDCDPDKNGNPSDAPPETLGQCVEPGRDYDSNPIPEYKVIFIVLNRPPFKPSASSVLNPCASGSAPEAQGCQLKISWNYDDFDNDPQESYEVLIDDTSSFTVPMFNYVADPSSSSSYDVNLDNDTDPNDWDQVLSFGNTYYYKVRVKDGGPNGSHEWSEWSDVNLAINGDPLTCDLGDTGCFIMPSHAYPYVDFKWCPETPTPLHEVNFCSVDEGVCDTSSIPPTPCQPPSSETECYDFANLPTPCFSWSWDFTTDATIPLGESGEENPSLIRFNNEGSKIVTLTVKDAQNNECIRTGSVSVQIPLPLPGWKEVPPF